MEQTMQKTKTLFIGFIMGLIAAFGIQCSSGTSPTKAEASPRNVTAAGKFQISITTASFYIYETTINTETGEVVSRIEIEKSDYDRLRL
jgi:hypothetical protein